jgi:hypothetical protein
MLLPLRVKSRDAVGKKSGAPLAMISHKMTMTVFGRGFVAFIEPRREEAPKVQARLPARLKRGVNER